ncbi:hypothetical protein BD408DRAFT_414611 [Parasitella parasitica]|nr:hypothetical protein BD408DRAFT_414611 [Parasitella parasitica]
MLVTIILILFNQQPELLMYGWIFTKACLQIAIIIMKLNWKRSFLNYFFKDILMR